MMICDDYGSDEALEVIFVVVANHQSLDACGEMGRWWLMIMAPIKH